MKVGAPGGCVVCRYPTTTVDDRFGSVHASCIAEAARLWTWLSVLVAGPLGGCLVCRTSTVWRHPIHGPVHPACVRRAMGLLEDDGGVEPVVMPAAQPGASLRRGAYARRAAMVG